MFRVIIVVEIDAPVTDRHFMYTAFVIWTVTHQLLVLSLEHFLPFSINPFAIFWDTNVFMF